ncbi:hypothetical protein DYBT9275_03172 [Dyadobacter sp. CECT 9275]|uniref:FtsX-like permease family protein n=1 Tax=Dyadobacter helix TaxID=2822344 RepID=A0A916N6H0_9BACT|nr:ABC transporter permease [Dyadobacter sp. CECT 9275]CAG5003528.1 hypothetical protein DYBT9275_03172 [Dyadobacter sp. CECT 9275]
MNHLKIAIRNLKSSRLFTLLNIVGLAGGMLSAVFILLWVQNEMSFDTYHKNSADIYRVTNTLSKQDPPWIWSNSPYVLGEAAKNLIPGVEKTTSFSAFWRPVVVKIDHKVFDEKRVARVDANWFDFFDYAFIRGDKSSLADINSLVFTESKAKAWFGNEDPVGKIIRIDTTDFVVRGVLKDNPANSSFQYDVLIPVASSMQNSAFRANSTNWRNFNFQVFMQLKPGTSLKPVADQINRLYQENRKDSSIVASFIPLTDIHFDTSFQSDALIKGNVKTVTMMGIIGVLILVIASINFVNLTTALASKRSREVGLKKMLGAGRGRLFGQFLTESAIQILAAVMITVLLFRFCLPLFNDFTEKHFVLNGGNGIIWLLLSGCGVATFLLAGIYPSILLSALKPAEIVKASTPKSSNSRFRQGLVVIQFAISIILMIGTLSIDRQLDFMKKQNPGYNREHVFTITPPVANDMKQRANARAYLKENIGQLAVVKGIATANESIVNMGNSHSGSLNWQGKPDDFIPTVTTLSAGNEFPKLLGMKLAAGRWLENDRKMDSANVVLNETAVKTFGLKAPVIGQSFEFQGRKGQIVGVVKDFHFNSFHEEIAPLVMDNYPDFQEQIFVKAEEANMATVLAQTEKIWQNRFPGTPFKYQFLDEQYNNLYKDEQQAVKLFNFFASVAILISCLGLFGLATFTAQNRTREIGIRKVLGATVYGIVALLSADFLKLVLIASVVAIPVAHYFMEQWLAGFAYHIEMQWWIFADAGILALFIALATISFQSIKAALTNPVDSLRSE